MYFMGLDGGTLGTRAVIVDESGRVVGSSSVRYEGVEVDGLPEGWREQRVESWTRAARLCILEAVAGMREKGLDPEGIGFVSVTSTSGTIVPVRNDGSAVHNAVLYNDSRAGVESERVSHAGRRLEHALGYRFRPSFGLPKVVWFTRRMPDVIEDARWFVHAADYLVGWLTGEFGVTDFTNALKTGYDLIADEWPTDVLAELDIDVESLPRVQPPGTPVGRLTPDRADSLGLPADALVTSGMTDGCASQTACGAVRPGDWNSTLGTTLVVKGVTEELLRDEEGVVYSHRHPEGHWMPGGASNTGGECIETRFEGQDLAELDKRASALMPSEVVCYPLVGRGERFPFHAPNATGFSIGLPGDEVELYASYLDGVGYVERLAYESLERLGAEVGDRIYCAGGGCRSDLWLQARASILNRVMVRPDEPGAAMGAAVVSGSTEYFSSISEAAGSMVRVAATVEPDASATGEYSERYAAFTEGCRRLCYLRER